MHRQNDNKRKKLFKVMMLGAMAMVMMTAHRTASAAETHIYQCTNPQGQVIFQDFACADNQQMKLLKVEINQSADTQVGLREYEKVVLARLHQRQLLDRALQVVLASKKTK